MAGDALHKWFSGSGDYEITSNTLIPGSAAEVAKPVEFSKSGKRGTRVVEKEYVTDIISSSTSGAFNNQTFRINPADAATFPWLSGVASEFEEYQLNGIIFEFRSTSSAFNATGQALGVVIMATDYDALDQPYTTKLQMENADYANSTAANCTALHGIECAKGDNPVSVLYCAAWPPSKGDQRLYDLGLFQIATYGVQGTSVNLGELWVSYDVTFYKKQMFSGQIGNGINWAYVLPDAATVSTGANWLGLHPTVCGTLGITVNGLVVSFPKTFTTGYYEIEMAGFATTSVGLPNNLL